MITLTGILRQAGEVKIKEQPRLKVVVEHETARENGLPDLRLETFFLDPGEAAVLPRTGQPVHIEVRPWANGKTVNFAAVRVVAAVEPADPLQVA